MSKEIIQDFGKTVANLRKKRGMTQSVLAKKSNVQATFLSTLEKGQRNVTIDTASRIAGSLGVPLAELFASIDNHFEIKKTPTPVTFIKLGGTWDMQQTANGLQGSGRLDDESFAKLEESVGFDERKLCVALDKEFKDTKSVGTSLAEHLPWVPDIATLASGEFIPLFSGDSSHYRPAVVAPTLSYLLRRATIDPSRQLLVGMGTDTVDLFLPYLDVFLFDRPDILPILVTGANRSHREENSDAPQNFHDLAEATRLPLKSGAYYVFNRTIYKGGDIVKLDPNEDPTSVDGQKTFFAPQGTQARVGFLDTEASRREKHVEQKINLIDYSALDLYDAIQSTVTVNLGDMANIDEEVRKMLDPSTKAIVIVAHALGNAPLPVRRAAIKAAKAGKLVMNVSRSLRGNTSDRYSASLSSANQRELAGTEHRIIDGGRVNSRTAKALLVRALLERRDQKNADELIQSYKTRTF